MSDSESLHGFDTSSDQERAGSSCGNAEARTEAEEQQAASSSSRTTDMPQHELPTTTRLRTKTFDLEGRFDITARPEDFHDLSVLHLGLSDSDTAQVFHVMADVRGLLAFLGGNVTDTWEKLFHGAYPELASRSVADLLSWTVLRTKKFREACLQQRSDLQEPRLQQRSECPDVTGLTHFIEFWAGSGTMTKEHVRRGLTCRRFDLDYNSLHDCTTGAGLRLWLEEVMRMAPGGLIWNGTQCSSFVMLSRSKSQRRVENGYYGDESRLFVQKGNEQMKVLSLIIAIAALVGVDWILEQPSGSVLPLMQPLKRVMEFDNGFKVTTWLGMFGAESPKPLQLWCNNRRFTALSRTRPRSTKTGLVDRLDKGKFRGRKHALKQSQSYPAEFAAAVAALAPS